MPDSPNFYAVVYFYHHTKYKKYTYLKKKISENVVRTFCATCTATFHPCLKLSSFYEKCQLQKYLELIESKVFKD